jgi:hypothetical protein
LPGTTAISERTTEMQHSRQRAKIGKKILKRISRVSKECRRHS